MSVFDIRNQTAGAITEIKIAEESRFDYIATGVFKNTSSEGGVKIMDTQDNRYVIIKNKEHAKHLRAALDKAEELGWLK